MGHVLQWYNREVASQGWCCKGDVRDRRERRCGYNGGKGGSVPFTSKDLKRKVVLERHLTGL